MSIQFSPSIIDLRCANLATIPTEASLFFEPNNCELLVAAPRIITIKLLMEANQASLRFKIAKMIRYNFIRFNIPFPQPNLNIFL